MKDWKVVDVRALVENSRKKVHAAAFALLAVLGLVFCAGLCGAQQAWADETEVDLGAPAHVKKLTENDGKWYLTLDVTGRSQSVEGKTKANVVVVLDTSGSMRNTGVKSFEYMAASSDSRGDRYGLVEGEYVKLEQSRDGGYYYRSSGREWIKYDTSNGLFVRKETTTSRIDAAKSAVNELAGSLLKLNTKENPDAVQMALVTFNNKAEIVKTSKNGSWFTDLSDFESKFKSVDARSNTGTNWEDALSFANGIEGDSDPTYVVFVSDGNPTFRNTQGDYKSLDYDWTYWNAYGIYGTGDDKNSTTVERCYDHAKDDAYDIVHATPGKEFYAIGAFGDVDRMQSLVSYAYEKSDTADAPAGHYFAATDHEGLESAFSSIVADITKDYSYASVKITDVMSEYVDVVVPEGADQPVFTYKKGGAEWTTDEGAPAASYAKGTKTVTWDLTSIGTLDDVVYSVTFQVELNQKAYDTVAGLTSGNLTYVAENYPNIKRDDGNYSVYTNKEATLDYVSQKTVNGGDPEEVGKGQAIYVSPDMSVLSSLTISKVWGDVPAGFNKDSESVNIEVKQDNEDYESVTLNKDNDWTRVLTVPVGYEYSVSETTGLGDGWTTSYSSSKDVADGKNAVAFKGEAVARSGSVFVTNTYKASDATLGGESALKVQKILSGREWTSDDSFKFTLEAVTDGAPMPSTGGATVTVTDSTADHTASFGDITYTAAGTYQYKISEDKGGTTVDGITYAAPVNVTVTVTDDGGKLKATVNYPDGKSAFTFTNTYEASEATLGGDSALKVQKILSGREWTSDDSFKFTLEAVTDGAPMPSTGGETVTVTDLTAGHTASFGDITYAAAGTYQYKISEDNAGTTVDGITYAASQTVTVTVEDDGEGQLSAVVEYGADESAFTFINTYGAGAVTLDGSSALKVTKKLEGREWAPDDSFEFTLEAVTPNAPMPSSASVTIGYGDEVKAASFGDITYTEAKTYQYRISEAKGGTTAKGLAYDGNACVVTVNVSDNLKGQLQTSVSYEGVMTFTNAYSVEPESSSLTGDPDGAGEGHVPVTKKLTGRDLVDGEFGFRLTDADGKVVAEGSNDADGRVSMDPVTFSKPGTYRYTLSEVEGDAENVTYDASEYEVTAEVADDGDGTMSVAWKVEGGELGAVSFENAYAEPEPPVVPADPGDGDDGDEPASSDDKEPVIAKTGDSAPFAAASIGTLALAAAVACFFARRKLG